MKYKTPELTALTPAINAIQVTDQTGKPGILEYDSFTNEEHMDGSGAYADWE
jgi:hypothetical protein